MDERLEHGREKTVIKFAGVCNQEGKKSGQKPLLGKEEEIQEDTVHQAYKVSGCKFFSEVNFWQNRMDLLVKVTGCKVVPLVP